ncbi:unnamed protein product [Cuscuta epithymum]|uniref:X8 domain-containing protein n=1 Tax=Cuscuta epithymum TaxID=186058 RepID=A0AAV0DVM6_9ASTE|nr:unnamed protein product [Cuscuta epithymum]
MPQKMLNILCIFHLFFLHFFFNVAGHEPAVGVMTITIQDSSPVALQAFSGTGVPVAVSVPAESLNAVSRSVLEAENWVRTHVLAHYPATNITAIVAGHGFFCQNPKEEEREGLLPLILPSMKNIHYSLTRWGLDGEIKVSTSFSTNCLHPSSENTYRFVSPETFHVIPVLEFLRRVDSPYLVTPLSDTPISESIKHLGFHNLTKIHLISEISPQKPTTRKLAFYPFALPPLVGRVNPPPFSVPVSPSYGPHLPPCSPSGEVPGPAPSGGVLGGLWCVAKPSVPEETLKEALDYACGEGGADCAEIQPQGRCYNPNTIVAHASYAFNSYWQRKKMTGGTCGFHGTAMLINSDPSYRHCRFALA